MNAFMLTTDVDLGKIQFVQIWHDNTGTGRHANWMLRQIVILDKHKKQWYVLSRSCCLV
jgi:hypothetical protein